MVTVPTTEVIASGCPFPPDRARAISSSRVSLTLRREAARVCPTSQSRFSGLRVTEMAFFAIR
jgi:hypothetical protein